MLYKLKQLSRTSPWVMGSMHVVGIVVLALAMYGGWPGDLLSWVLVSAMTLYSAKNAYFYLSIEDGYLPGEIILEQTNDYYAKEILLVHSHDKILLSYAQANDFIRHIWAKEGRKRPPMIVEISGTIALSGRIAIFVPPQMCTRTVILHEVAHILCSRQGHRNSFIRTFVDLLDRHIKMDLSGERLFDLLRLDSPYFQVIDGRFYKRHDAEHFAELADDGNTLRLIPINSCIGK